MDEKISFSTTVCPEKTTNDYVDLVGKWNPELEVELKNLSMRTHGPSTIVRANVLIIESSVIFPNISQK